MEPTVTNWVEHLTASEVAGQIYPYVGTEWLWFHVATAAGEAEEHEKLARKKHGSNDYKSNIPEW